MSPSKPQKYILIYSRKHYFSEQKHSVTSFSPPFIFHISGFFFPPLCLLSFQQIRQQTKISIIFNKASNDQKAAQPDAVVVLVDPELVVEGRLFCKFQHIWNQYYTIHTHPQHLNIHHASKYEATLIDHICESFYPLFIADWRLRVVTSLLDSELRSSLVILIK